MTDPTCLYCDLHDTLHAALAAVQSDLPHVTPDATGGRGNRYATVAAVNRAVLPLLATHGLTWTVTTDIELSTIVGRLTHAATGDTVEATWPMPKSPDPQQVSSAVTYARRVLLCAIVGVSAEDDDDGMAASTGSQRRAEPSGPSTMERATELVARHVPDAHLAALADVYSPGCADWRDLPPVALGKLTNALADPAKRQRLLDGLATVAAAGDVGPTSTPDRSAPPTAEEAAARHAARLADSTPPTVPTADPDPDGAVGQAVAEAIDAITGAIRSGEVSREAVDRAYVSIRQPKHDRPSHITSSDDLGQVTPSTLLALSAAVADGSVALAYDTADA